MFKWFHKKKNNHSKHLSELKEKLSIQELPHFDIEAIKQFALKDWELGETHGLPHWQRVERNGIILATLEVNITVIRLFAYLHDKCRIDNGYDVEHGKRAAIMIHEIRHTLLKELTDNEFELLFKACELHTTMLRTGNPTIDTCFDADRLDLERVEIRPEAERMATSKGRYFASHLGEFYKIVDCMWINNDLYPLPKNNNL